MKPFPEKHIDMFESWYFSITVKISISLDVKKQTKNKQTTKKKKTCCLRRVSGPSRCSVWHPTVEQRLQCPMLLQIHDMYPFTIRTIDKILIKNVHQKVQKIYTDVEKYLWIAHVQKVDSAS